jgi:methylmalonyl-CoA mutase cobalamin-binding domain/chain
MAIEQLADAIERGDREGAISCARDLVGRIPPEDLLKSSTEGIKKVGEKFENHEVFLADLILAAQAVYGVAGVLEPYLDREKMKAKALGTVVIGTIEGDVHSVGKDLVAMVLRASGFNVIDLGIDVAAEEFAAAAKEHVAKIAGASALLSTTMLGLREIPRALEKEGIRETVRVMFGGAPVTERFTKATGGDLYAEDAFRAVKVAKKAMGVA